MIRFHFVLGVVSNIIKRICRHKNNYTRFIISDVPKTEISLSRDIINKRKEWNNRILENDLN